MNARHRTAKIVRDAKLQPETSPVGATLTRLAPTMLTTVAPFAAPQVVARRINAARR